MESQWQRMVATKATPAKHGCTVPQGSVLCHKHGCTVPQGGLLCHKHGCTVLQAGDWCTASKMPNCPPTANTINVSEIE